jgi:hypothetical protein
MVTFALSLWRRRRQPTPSLDGWQVVSKPETGDETSFEDISPLKSARRYVFSEQRRLAH